MSRILKHKDQEDASKQWQMNIKEPRVWSPHGAATCLIRKLRKSYCRLIVTWYWGMEAKQGRGKDGEGNWGGWERIGGGFDSLPLPSRLTRCSSVSLFLSSILVFPFSISLLVGSWPSAPPSPGRPSLLRGGKKTLLYMKKKKKTRENKNGSWGGQGRKEQRVLAGPRLVFPRAGVSFTSPRSVKTWPEVICSETFHLWDGSKKRNYWKLVTEISLFFSPFQLHFFRFDFLCTNGIQILLYITWY